MVKSIFVNFPTNIGDTILSFPAFDKICACYPNAKFTAIASPKTKDFILRHAFIDEVVVYNKNMSLRQKIRFFRSLHGKYEMAVDFKHSLLPLLLGVKKHTPLLRRISKTLHAIKAYDSHVEKLTDSGKNKAFSEFLVTDQERRKLDSLRIGGSICIATSSKSSLKEYPYSNLKKVVEMLSQKGKVALLGDSESKKYYKDIGEIPGVTDLSGKTSLLDVYYILSRHASACILVDSSILHLASYLDVPILALFGPTGVDRFGPWSKRYKVLTRASLPCRPCNKPECIFGHECMDIAPKKVVEEVLLLNRYENP